MQERLAESTRASLQGLGTGTLVPIRNLHLTVAFLGAVPESALAAVRSVACGCAGALGAAREPLELKFDAIAFWRRPRIVCAVATRAADSAGVFADMLTGMLAQQGFAPDLKPFQAHVTLARHVRRVPTTHELEPVVWSFEEFALVESRTEPSGALYSVLESWSLYSARRS